MELPRDSLASEDECTVGPPDEFGPGLHEKVSGVGGWDWIARWHPSRTNESEAVDRAFPPGGLCVPLGSRKSMPRVARAGRPLHCLAEYFLLDPEQHRPH